MWPYLYPAELKAKSWVDFCPFVTFFMNRGGWPAAENFQEELQYPSSSLLLALAVVGGRALCAAAGAPGASGPPGAVLSAAWGGEEPQEPCWSAGLGVAALDSGQGRGQVVLGRGGPDLIVSCWIPTFDSPLVVETCTLGSTLSSTVVVVMATSTSGLADGTAKFISTVVVGMATSTSGLADGTAKFTSTGVLWTATLAATLVCGLVDLLVFSLAPGSSGVGERCLLWWASPVPYDH